ncbi:MAG TPA: hypothetical protein PKA03_12265 [Tabrizicola sp.]|nr:hypothetical protein [Tabrizicola sp.]
MRILEQDKNRLVIEIRPVGLMVLCFGLFLLFFGLGFGMHHVLPLFADAIGLPQAAGFLSDRPIPGMSILGFASVIPLAIAVLMLKTRRLTFNRAAGLITINTRGILGRSERTLPLAAFQGATLASSRSGDNGTTHRAILQFSDENGPVPLTPYSTSGSGPSRTVNAINAWLGPVVQAGGQTVNLSGPQAAEAIAALEKLGIKIPR